MRVMLMRHAEAGDADPSRWPDDRTRPLTEEGRVDHRRVALALKAMEVGFERLLTSPLMRARQTAEVTVAAYGWTGPIEESEALGDRGSVDDVLRHLGRCDPESTVLCVGHEPQLSRLAAVLVSERGDARIDLKKSGVIAIDCGGGPTRGRGTLRFHLRPKPLLRIAP